MACSHPRFPVAPLAMPFAEAAGYRVHYRATGAGDPVLFLSGLAADHTAWALQAAALEQDHRVIVLDAPGIGLTEGPDDTLTSELLADVAAGLLEQVAKGPAHVVGTSLGGAIAQQLALSRPELVRTLSLHGTWGRSDTYLTTLLRSWEAAARVLPRLELCRQMWLFSFTVWHFNDQPEAIAQLERSVLDRPDLQTPEQFAAQAEACVAHDVLDRLGEIAAPTYLSVGDRDLLTPAHHAYAIKEHMPGAVLRVWPRMGHVPFLEIPDEFARRQREFFAAN